MSLNTSDTRKGLRAAEELRTDIERVLRIGKGGRTIGFGQALDEVECQMVKTGPGKGELSLKVDFGELEHVVSNIRSCVSRTSVFHSQAYKRSKDLVARLSCGRDSEDRLLSERDVAYSVLSGSCSGAAEQTAKAFEQLVDDIATWHEASRPGCPSDELLGETLLQRVHTAAEKYCLFLTGIGSAVWRNRPGLKEQTAAGLDPEVMARKLRAGELITSEEEKRIDEYLTDLASWRRWSSTVRSIQSSLAKLVITSPRPLNLGPSSSTKTNLENRLHRASRDGML